MDRFWVADPESVWLPCQLQDSACDPLTFTAEGGKAIKVPAGKLKELERVSEIQVEGIPDICALDVVCEGALLHTVRVRYLRKEIYTRVARIILAANPFEALPLYSSQIIDEYRVAEDSAELPPHIFSIGADAVKGLRGGEKDQAVVISGESGAGKTESAKLIMSFVAEATRPKAAPGAQGSAAATRSLDEKVLRTNPVLEAFGNAMTVRNNNSSRFGKWLDFCFSASAGMLGCKITHYLLEVTRICHQSKGERSYHIFFQLLQARKTEELKYLQLMAPKDYTYLKGSELVAPGINDEKCFVETKEALSGLGFTQNEQEQIFRIVAAVLLLGNCGFKPKKDVEELELADPVPVKRVAELLGLSHEALTQCLLFRTIKVGGQNISKSLRENEANAARDGLSRILYGLLFSWLISRMNETLSTQEEENEGDSSEGEAALPGASARLLGILDIAGFESFEKNSLEQLLINLSNEVLQQHFNLYVFSTEVADYRAEGLADLAERVTFADNKDVLALLDGSGGVLDLLDEEVAVNGTDDAFVAKIAQGQKKSSKFIPGKFKGSFGIQHYAGQVTYSVAGFLAKNADKPPDDMAELMRSSTLEVAQALVDIHEEQLLGTTEAASNKRRSIAPPGKGRKAKSASARFRASLKSLAAKIEKANPHFIRCIKPNSEKVPQKFTSTMVREQLLLSGVLDAVKIRRSGFAMRMLFSEFLNRFVCTLYSLEEVKTSKRRGLEIMNMVKASGSEKDPQGLEHRTKALVHHLKESLGWSLEDLVFGKTKIFGRANILDSLEARRSKVYREAAAKAEALFRGRLLRRRLRDARPVLQQIKDWVKQCGAELWAERHGPVLKFLPLGGKSPEEAARAALGEFRELTEQARDFWIMRYALKSAQLIANRLELELEALVKLQSQVVALDPIAIDKAMAIGRDLELPVAEVLSQLERRSAALQKQLPLTAALKLVAVEGEKASIQALTEAVQAVKAAGLKDHPEDWVPELGAADLLHRVEVTLERLKPQEPPPPSPLKAAEEPPQSVSGSSRRKTITGLGAADQIALLQQLREADEVFDVAELGRLLREAVGNGVEPRLLEGFQESHRRLHRSSFLLQVTAEVTKEAGSGTPPFSVLQKLKNLSQQIHELGGNEHVAKDARRTVQHAVKRHSTLALGASTPGLQQTTINSRLEEELTGAFADLREFEKLKSPDNWCGHESLADGERMLAHSQVMIPESLTRLPASLEALALQNFRNILTHMGDKPAQEVERLAALDGVIALAKSTPALRDEVFVQVIKQVTENPSERSMVSGWELLLRVCQAAEPSDVLSEFLRQHCKQAATHSSHRVASLAQQCMEALSHGARAGAPSDLHLSGGQAKPHTIKVQVHFVDGTSCALAVTADALLRHLGAEVRSRRGVQKWRDFAFFQQVEGEEVRLLPDQILVSELLDCWSQLHEATGQQSRLIWQRRFLFPDEVLKAEDQAHAELTFKQASASYLRSPVQPTDDKVLLELAEALLLAEKDPTVLGAADPDVLPRLLPSGVNEQTVWAWRQRWKELKPMLSKMISEVPHFQRIGQAFTLLQQTVFFGAWRFSARESHAVKDCALSGAPSQQLHLRQSGGESDVWIYVDMEGVHLELLGAPGTRWSFLYRDAKVGTTQGGRGTGEGPRLGRLLQWGAKPGFLQLVVWAQYPVGSQEQQLISLACTKALDVSYLVHTALTEGIATALL